MKVQVAQLCPTLCKSMSYTVYGILQARILEWFPFPSPGDLPNPGIEPRSPTLLADSLPAEPQGKPKNTGMGGLSLLQQIFPTHESNWGLLLCRQILYQLSSQGSPLVFHLNKKLQKKREGALTQATAWANLENIPPSKEATRRGRTP